MSNAIQFLASVASRQQYKQLFAAPGALAQICERVIVPNMQLRDADVETFEDNPDEFMLKDLEVGATFCLRIFL
jgi:exportin-2 (importin alpha re-exporter)